LLDPSSKVFIRIFGKSSLVKKIKGALGAVLLNYSCSLSMGLLAALNGYRDLFRATGRPDSECKSLLTAPDRFGTTVDGMPAYDMRSSFTNKDLTAQLEQARFKGLGSISAFALSPSPNWRTSTAIAFLLVSCCLRMMLSVPSLLTSFLLP
jgi:hypothetical protein